jgi:hypothetical protein
VLHRVLSHHFDRFLAESESRFEQEYGYFRPVVKEVVEKYLDCGNPRCGFVLIRKAHVGQTKRRSSPGPRYPHFIKGRVDSEPEAGDSVPRKKRNFLYSTALYRFRHRLPHNSHFRRHSFQG